MLVIDSANSGLHGALLVGALGRLALVVERPARQARHLQQVRQIMVMPQSGNQTRFVGAADLFDRIKVCNFLGTRPPRAGGHSLPAGFSPHRQRPCSAVLQSVVLVADVIERRDLTAGELLSILMSQRLELELRTVRAALGAQTVDAVQAVAAHPRADLLLGNRPPPSQQLRAAFACQEALGHFQLELRFVLLHETPESLSNFWGAIQSRGDSGMDSSIEFQTVLSKNTIISEGVAISTR